MDRREFIQLGMVTVSVGVLSASGGLAVYGTDLFSDDSSDDQPLPGDQSTQQTAITGSDFTVTGKTCAEDSETGTATVAQVEQSDDGDSLVVSGVVSAADMCKSARLADVAYDPQANLLQLTLETFNETNGSCAMCITDVSFEATIGIEGSVPADVELSVQDE